MAHPTLKSINKHLPRLDQLRRDYMFYGETGTLHGRGVLSNAVMDLDEQGDCDCITLYCYGDAKERKHYYASEHPEVVDITDIIVGVLSGYHPEGYVWEPDRHMVVAALQDYVLEVLEGEEQP